MVNHGTSMNDHDKFDCFEHTEGTTDGYDPVAHSPIHAATEGKQLHYPNNLTVISS